MTPIQKSLRTAFLLCGVLAANLAGATEVSCGNSTLGVRLTAIDPGLVSGFCYAQQGNFIGDDFTAASTALGSTLTMRGKEKADDGDVASANLGFTMAADRLSGTWSLPSSLWTTYGRLFLAFHFGDGKPGEVLSNPDSFVLELLRPTTAGDWRFYSNDVNAKLTGLSNIYILSEGTCTTHCGTNDNQIPEPGSLALVGLALASVGAIRRRIKA